MKAYTIFIRDALGLLLITSSAVVLFGIHLDVVALFNYIFHEEAFASTYLYESLPMLSCLIPAVLIAKFINQPKWIAIVKAARAQEVLKSASQ
ncbi:D-fructose-6-phosphate amidotransferase [Photobacterium sagamiensis]|uniref:D-fructose-6-phosphate amidotransferase n=1 Tax=Photobacterium sagamiensis TaxID=2910241 RepID=UPI003D0A6255